MKTNIQCVQCKFQAWKIVEPNGLIEQPRWTPPAQVCARPKSASAGARQFVLHCRSHTPHLELLAPKIGCRSPLIGKFRFLDAATVKTGVEDRVVAQIDLISGRFLDLPDAAAAVQGAVPAQNGRLD